MSAYDLARPEIRDLVPYQAEAVPDDYTRLNANEVSLDPYGSELALSSNRYPELRPQSLQKSMARLFGVATANLCPTRGSSEAIDLLVRTFCRAYRDSVVVLPPTFEMYAAYANMQAAEVRYAELQSKDNFRVDWQAVDAKCDNNTRIVFLCSPNNPTGNLIPVEAILEFAKRREGKSIIVIDEAYIEFSGQVSMVSEVTQVGNLVVLRTLSKAYALAGARCGALIASAEIINLVAALMSPYGISMPVTRLVLDALRSEQIVAAEQQIAAIIVERERLQQLLADSASIEHVWDSSANFLLVRFHNLPLVRAALAEHRILIREYGNNTPLQNCARITVGTTAESNRLMRALDDAGAATQ